MTKQFTVTAKAEQVIGGITYSAIIGEEMTVENSGQVIEGFEALFAMCYRSLQLARKNMPKGAGADKQTGDQPQTPPKSGTIFYKVDSVEIGFDPKSGEKVCYLKGGPYQKFGVPLYPEKHEWLLEFNGGVPVGGMQPGSHKLGEFYMALTKTTDGKVILNGLFAKPLVQS